MFEDANNNGVGINKILIHCAYLSIEGGHWLRPPLIEFGRLCKGLTRRMASATSQAMGQELHPEELHSTLPRDV